MYETKQYGAKHVLFVSVNYIDVLNLLVASRSELKSNETALFFVSKNPTCKPSIIQIPHAVWDLLNYNQSSDIL
jgi:hypothetical protein